MLHAAMNFMVLGAFSLACASGWGAEPAWSAAVESIQIADLKTHIGTLASDALQGRESGTVSGHAASAYVITELRKLGVSPAGQDGQFVQEFNGNMRNLLAKQSGRDPRVSDEVILVSAHYDHVGFGTPKNSRGPIGFIHNGADDNASGVAALLEVIDAVKKLPQPPRRTIVFAFWDAEEKGLLGSKHWLTSPTVPKSQVKLVINADMIGRLTDAGIEITGWRAASGWRRLLSEANSPSPPTRLDPIDPLAPRLPLDFTWDLREDSDHYPFIAAGIPAVMLHTGKHDDYHRPSDDADKLNYPGLQRTARLLLLSALLAADADSLPAFRSEGSRETKQQQAQIEQPLPVPSGRLGIAWRPELVGERIVEVRDVAPQSAAAAAGLRAGDRILSFAGRDVSDVVDFRTIVVVAPKTTQALIQRSGESDPKELTIRLAGEPTRWGLAWRTDPAEPNCVILVQVIPHSPADLAGLQRFDRILQLNNKQVTAVDVAAVSRAGNDPVPVIFERQGRIDTTVLKPVIVSDR